ncbi:MAG: hypothetical protein FJ298_04575 [Planctomycetes bacterium]|nr:hypothetical protein [Planctomycetota bacterium]
MEIMQAVAYVQRASSGLKGSHTEALRQALELLQSASDRLIRVGGTADAARMRARIHRERGIVGLELKRRAGPASRGMRLEEEDESLIDINPINEFLAALKALDDAGAPPQEELIHEQAALNELLADAYEVERSFRKAEVELQKAGDLRCRLLESGRSVRGAVALANVLRKRARLAPSAESSFKETALRELERWEWLKEARVNEMLKWARDTKVNHG